MIIGSQNLLVDNKILCNQYWTSLLLIDFCIRNIREEYIIVDIPIDLSEMNDLQWSLMILKLNTIVFITHFLARLLFSISVNITKGLNLLNIQLVVIKKKIGVYNSLNITEYSCMG